MMKVTVDGYDVPIFSLSDRTIKELENCHLPPLDGIELVKSYTELIEYLRENPPRVEVYFTKHIANLVQMIFPGMNRHQKRSDVVEYALNLVRDMNSESSNTPPNVKWDFYSDTRKQPTDLSLLIVL